jgi:hypothetical protein
MTTFKDLATGKKKLIFGDPEQAAIIDAAVPGERMFDAHLSRRNEYGFEYSEWMIEINAPDAEHAIAQAKVRYRQIHPDVPFEDIRVENIEERRP